MKIYTYKKLSYLNSFKLRKILSSILPILNMIQIYTNIENKENWKEKTKENWKNNETHNYK